MRALNRLSRLRPDHGSDRGSGTLLGLFVIAVMLVLGGTLVEVASAMRDSAHATDVAQQAARAGADKLDLTALRNGGAVRVDPVAAQAAALAYLRQVGETGTVVATPTGVSVTVTITRSGGLLPLVGINSVTVTSTAAASPLLN